MSHDPKLKLQMENDRVAGQLRLPAKCRLYFRSGGRRMASIRRSACANVIVLMTVSIATITQPLVWSHVGRGVRTSGETKGICRKA